MRPDQIVVMERRSHADDTTEREVSPVSACGQDRLVTMDRARSATKLETGTIEMRSDTRSGTALRMLWSKPFAHLASVLDLEQREAAMGSGTADHGQPMRRLALRRGRSWVGWRHMRHRLRRDLADHAAEEEAAASRSGALRNPLRRHQSRS